MKDFTEWVKEKLLSEVNKHPSFTYELADGSEVSVFGHFYAGSVGRRSSLGVPEEPDEEPSFEIDDIRDASGRSVMNQIPEEEFSAIQDYGMKSMHRDY